ncbi:tumor necrosis factor ligand superfamily member 9 [Ochotona curzoniae]|uniref:tumor necrosis factor ligand superfamily member 9 n=1 Tax=Ochotona curzoniae TaxID=130825 RepID=UPI001B34BABE|nr:tumor necrosis factor ligand superfamily member 9 [Ochotona curzoniae]
MHPSPAAAAAAAAAGGGASLDAEAAWPPPPSTPPARTCRPLLWALGTALLLLAATCAACVARTWASQGPAAGPEPAPDARAGLLPDVPAQSGLFAQLVAQSVLLTNGTVRWHSEAGLAGVALSRGVSYDEDAREVVVAQAGVYYVFLHLELQRVVARQGSGVVALSLHLQPPRFSEASSASALATEVHLPPACGEKGPDSAVGFKGRLLPLGAGQRLSVHLRATAEAHPAWQLVQGATLLGLFRVTPEVSGRLASH